MQIHKKALIVREGHLGDIVMSTVVVKPLWQKGYEQIDWLSNKRILELLPWIPHSGKGYVLQEKTDVFWQWGLLHKLRKERYDLFLLLEDGSRYYPLVWLVGAKMNAGYYKRRFTKLGLKYAWKIDCAQSTHFNYAHAIESLIGKTVPDPHPALARPSKNISSRFGLWAAAMDPRCIRVVIHPGTSHMSLRSWPLPHYEKLIGLLLAQPDIQVVLSGTSEELRDFRPANPRVQRCLPGQNLDELCRLIDWADLFISADTGPMHIADALQKPQVVFFGPTNSSETGPTQKNALKVDPPYFCRGCLFKKTEEQEVRMRKCQESNSPQCLISIAADEVMKLILSRWGTPDGVLTREILNLQKPVSFLPKEGSE